MSDTYIKSLEVKDIRFPTSPDDVLGHATIAKGIAPIKVATGQHCHNRIVFKQLLQAEGEGCGWKIEMVKAEKG